MYLVDGSNQAFRAFFAIRTEMRTKDGFPTKALFGFANMLRKLIRENSPDYVLVAFDRGLSFRNELYADYKGQRPDMPEELREQWGDFIPFCLEWGIHAEAIEGFEADDIIGTLAARYASEDLQVAIVSSDKDFAQLVNDNVQLFDIQGDRRYGPAEVVEKWGVAPERMIDLLSLMGDTSDNVPGVPGVGVKTAAKLLNQHGDLDAVIQAAQSGQIRGKRGAALAESEEVVALARQLITIRTDMELPFELSHLTLDEPDWPALVARLKRYDFRRLLAEVEERAGGTASNSSIDRSAYQCISTEAQLGALVDKLRQLGRFAFDTETTSLNPREARLVGMSFAWREASDGTASDGTDSEDANALPPVQAAYVPVSHVEGPNLPDALDTVRELLEDPAVEKTGQNLKYDHAVLAGHGCELRGIAGDTMLADYLLHADQRHGLDELARRYVDHKMLAYSEVTADHDGRFDQVPVDKATAYAAEDAQVVLLIEDAMTMPDEVARLYQEVELPLVPVLSRMEGLGIRVDVDALGALSTELETRIEAHVKAIHDEAGQTFNVNSTKALQQILFEERGLKPVKKTKTGYSTSAAVLEQLAEGGDALCQMILDYRSLAKLKSTYIDALPAHVGSDGRIHTSFHQAVAQTGRLSSNDPNLQNIPIRTAEGRRIRACFVPDPGHVFLSADYSQIELRVLAHFCGEGTLVEAFRAGEDIHRRTAAEVFGVAQALVNADQRRAAKAINFGLIYGMSAFRLSNELRIPRKTAQAYIDHYFERYPQVRAFMDSAVEQARERGYASTLYGRRRPVHGLDSRRFNERGAAERIAINTPVQGTAADLIKMAMLRVDRALRADHSDVRMLLQVHDELVFEIPESKLEEVAARVKAEMEAVAELAVPLRVDWGAGASWDAAH
jgi:DNA polymerase-1